jgi:predicted AAA+ superfamily ATPase
MNDKNNVSRLIPLDQHLNSGSVLLLGPRRTGKSWIIRNELKPDLVYNLLQSDTFQELSARPSLIRESIKPNTRLVVIDEIQKLPSLMDEVHLMIEETNAHFLLTGSSARKLKRTHTSLMAGRAKTRYLFPFTSAELGQKFDLFQALKFGMLPPVYLSDDPEDIISSYTGDYLREEIMAEALTRKIENFSRFLLQAAMCNAELINYESIGNDAQVPARTIREYYQILVDTLLGYMLEPLATTGKRKPVSHSKFYFFDVGIVNAIVGSFQITQNHPSFGKCFESFIMCELKAYLSYLHPKAMLHFWRTQLGDEVDFVINGEIAIEVKSTKMVTEIDLKGLKVMGEEHKLRRKIIVSRDSRKRVLNGVEILPYQNFLEDLWGGNII